MIDWFPTTIARITEGLPHEHAIAPHLGPQRRRCLLRMLRGGHPPGRAGRVQPTGRLRPRPPDRAAVAAGGPREPSGRGPRPDAGRRPRRPDPTAAGRDRPRHGPPHAPDRRPVPCDPRRRWPRPRDRRALGRRRGPEGQGRPGGARRGLYPPCPDRRGGRDLFWGRPTLVGIEPASMTAVFCANAADRTAETWEKALAPFSRLEFAVSDAAKGIGSP